MNKQKGFKTTKTFFAVVVLIIVFSAVYLIESELLSIKHSLQHEFKKSEGALISLHSHFGKLLTNEEEARLMFANQLAEEEQQFAVIDDPPVDENKGSSVLNKILKQDPVITQDVFIEEEEAEEEEEESWVHVDAKLNDWLKTTKPPNKDFIFHNKLPKSGSSTMNNVLKVLTRNHGFNFRKVEPNEVALHENGKLVKLLKKEYEKPFLLLKHHYYFNFKEHGMEQPTYINVIRDPLEWFTSRFYFSRYGWNRKPGCRDELCGMTQEELDMSIDECVAKRHPQCTDSSWYYFPFICGPGPECFNKTSDEAGMVSLEQAKHNLMNNYYAVGILEQFEETLMLLNHLLPSYFDGAVEIWKGEFVQNKQELTRTQHKQEMNEESRKFFLEGPLKYEKMFYDYARKIFNERLKYYKIQLPAEDGDS